MLNNHQRVIDPMIGEQQDEFKCISKYRYKWSLKRWSLLNMGTSKITYTVKDAFLKCNEQTLSAHNQTCTQLSKNMFSFSWKMLICSIIQDHDSLYLIKLFLQNSCFPCLDLLSITCIDIQKYLNLELQIPQNIKAMSLFKPCTRFYLGSTAWKTIPLTALCKTAYEQLQQNVMQC